MGSWKKNSLDRRTGKLYIHLTMRVKSMSTAKITPTAANALNQECIADKFKLINRLITNIYDEALRPLGITVSQMNILVVVAKFGEASPSQVVGWLNL